MRYANRRDELDVIPFEVVEEISEKTLVVRDMICTRDPAWKPLIVMQQCVNNETQNWLIESDPSGLCFKIRRQKDGKWKDAQGNCYTLDERPERWHRFGAL